MGGQKIIWMVIVRDKKKQASGYQIISHSIIDSCVVCQFNIESCSEVLTIFGLEFNIVSYSNDQVKSYCDKIVLFFCFSDC